MSEDDNFGDSYYADEYESPVEGSGKGKRSRKQGEPSRKKQKADVAFHLEWNYMQQMTLAGFVKKHNAYKATPNLTKEEKWKKVREELSTDPAFVGSVAVMCKWETIARKYARLEGRVDELFGLSKEGANLSGLPDVLTPLEELLKDMIVDRLKTEREKEAKSKKDAERETSMLTHEGNLLEEMTAAAWTPSAHNNPSRSKTPSTGSSSASEDDPFMAQINEILKKTATASDAELDMQLKERQAALENQNKVAEAQVRQMEMTMQVMANMTAMMEKMTELIGKASNSKN